MFCCTFPQCEISYILGFSLPAFKKTYYFFPLCLRQELNMGTSESKMTVVSTPKPDPIHQLKTRRLAQLADPRSPSCEINRTPIQVTPNHLVTKMYLLSNSLIILYINQSLGCCMNISVLFCIADERCSLCCPRSSRVSWPCVS